MMWKIQLLEWTLLLLEVGLGPTACKEKYKCYEPGYDITRATRAGGVKGGPTKGPTKDVVGLRS